MRHTFRTTVLSASVLAVLVGGQAIRANSAQPEPAATRPLPLVEASVTVPDAADAAVVVSSAAAPARGWSQAAPAHGTQEVRPEVLNGYNRAAAVAPPACHLSVSLLAAIGQVESGNLADANIDATNRVVPGILGPVLDGRRTARVADTDNGRWDGDSKWDRALGPMQLVPASWRVVGVDLDEDGTRDPQDVFDAAGAAMVYLCADGRDLSTAGDLEEAVLAYNHSVQYLRLVLAWKTAFDAADITGLSSQPALGAWAMPALPDVTQLPDAAPGTAGSTSARPETTRATTTNSTTNTATNARGSSTANGSAAGPTGSTGTSAPTDPGEAASASADPATGPVSGPGDTTGPQPTTDPTDPGPGPVDPTDPVDPTCLPDPTASAVPGTETSGDPAVVPTVTPTLIPSINPSPVPGDGTPADPCATVLPVVPAGASPSAD